MIAKAVRMMRIATVQVAEKLDADDGQDKAARAPGRRGDAARATRMTPERRAGPARSVAQEREAHADLEEFLPAL